MAKYSRMLALLLIDILIVNVSYIFAYLLRFEFDVNSDAFERYFVVYADNIVPITICMLAALGFFGVYTSMWRYASNEELFKIVLGVAVGTLLILAYMTMMGIVPGVPRSIYFITTMTTILLVAASRMSYRFLRDLRNPGAFNSMVFRVGKKDFIGANVTKVMVVGAGDAGASMIQEIKSHGEYGKKVVVAVDDNPAKLGKRILGVKVQGGHKQIRNLVRKYGVDEIIIAIPSAGKKTIQNIVNECNRTKCKIRILPALIDLINEKVSISKLRDVDIEDLLGRDSVILDTRSISGYLEGNIVMVTGGGGSIGAELCRQIGNYRPRRLIALDIYENTVFELAQEMKSLYPLLEFEVVIASVCNAKQMDEVFEKYKPHVIFHAAAHKHVPLMESQPKEAVINNIIGTKNLLDLADLHAASKFVMISTDKAVNPANIMGTTKRVAEMLLQDKAVTAQNTSYSAVRFGNVLGSNGSVIPIFRKQIEKGGPVTVTHPDITRYFMTIPEAVQLVIQTGAMAEGGEIFILDMGEPVKIMDLAENVIRLSGYVPNVDIDIAITGLRPGEKLYEELLLNDEGIEKTVHDKIYVGHPLPPNGILKEMLESPEETFTQQVEKLLDEDDEGVRSWLRKVVPNATI